MSCTESQTCSFLTPMDAVLDDIVRLSLPTPGRTFTLFNTFSFHRPLHHSIPSHSPFSLPPFLPAPEKWLLFVMMFCLPAASAHSLPPPTHKPCPLNLLFFDHKGPCLYFITCDTPGHKRKPLSLLLFYSTLSPLNLSLIHIWRCRRSTLCRSRWSPYH